MVSVTIRIYRTAETWFSLKYSYIPENFSATRQTQLQSLVPKLKPCTDRQTPIHQTKEMSERSAYRFYTMI